MCSNILNDISRYMQQGRVRNVKELVQQAIDSGISPKDILDKALIGGMNIVGENLKTMKFLSQKFLWRQSYEFSN